MEVSVGKADSDVLGDLQGIFDAGANSGTVEKISRKIESGEFCTEIVQSSQAGGMPEIVLWDCSRPGRNVCKDWFTIQSQKWFKFVVDLYDELRR